VKRLEARIENQMSGNWKRVKSLTVHNTAFLFDDLTFVMGCNKDHFGLLTGSECYQKTFDTYQTEAFKRGAGEESSPNLLVELKRDDHT